MCYPFLFYFCFCLKEEEINQPSALTFFLLLLFSDVSQYLRKKIKGAGICSPGSRTPFAFSYTVKYTVHVGRYPRISGPSPLYIPRNPSSLHIVLAVPNNPR